MTVADCLKLIDAGVLPAVWFDFISILLFLFFAIPQVYVEAAKVYVTKNACVKTSVKSQVTLLCISLKSESWNDSRKFQVTWKPSLKPTLANLRFLELWERRSMSINPNCVSWENRLKETWSKKDKLCVKLPFSWRI